MLGGWPDAAAPPEPPPSEKKNIGGGDVVSPQIGRGAKTQFCRWVNLSTEDSQDNTSNRAKLVIPQLGFLLASVARLGSSTAATDDDRAIASLVARRDGLWESSSPSCNRILQSHDALQYATMATCRNIAMLGVSDHFGGTTHRSSSRSSRTYYVVRVAALSGTRLPRPMLQSTLMGRAHRNNRIYDTSPKDKGNVSSSRYNIMWLR